MAAKSQASKDKQLIHQALANHIELGQRAMWAVHFDSYPMAAVIQRLKYGRATGNLTWYEYHLYLPRTWLADVYLPGLAVFNTKAGHMTLTLKAKAVKPVEGADEAMKLTCVDVTSLIVGRLTFINTAYAVKYGGRWWICTGSQKKSLKLAMDSVADLMGA